MSTHILLHLSLFHCIFPPIPCSVCHHSFGRLHAASHLGRSDRKDNKRHILLFKGHLIGDDPQQWSRLHKHSRGWGCTEQGAPLSPGPSTPWVRGQEGGKSLSCPDLGQGSSLFWPAALPSHPRPPPTASILGLCRTLLCHHKMAAHQHGCWGVTATLQATAEGMAAAVAMAWVLKAQQQQGQGKEEEEEGRGGWRGASAVVRVCEGLWWGVADCSNVCTYTVYIDTGV